jgi:transcriptional regulator with XRE-family HTH domain
MPKSEIHPTDRAIARRIAEARTATGLDKGDVAERLKITNQGYTPYERGDHAFTVVELEALSRVLGRSVEWFLGLEGERPADEGLVMAAMRSIRSPLIRSILVSQAQALAKLDAEGPSAGSLSGGH